MSIQGRNALYGSTVNVLRPTTGDDTITWSAVSGLTGVKYDLMPVTDEIRRNVFGVDSDINLMALDHTRTILKGDGITVTAGAHANTKFRVSSALQFHKFTQLGLVATTESFAFPLLALQQISGDWFVLDDNTEDPDGYVVKVGADYYIDDAVSSGLALSFDGTDFYIEDP